MMHQLMKARELPVSRAYVLSRGTGNPAQAQHEMMAHSTQGAASISL